MNALREISDAVLNIELTKPMSTRGFEAHFFSDVLNTDPTLLVFLRHLG
jgi:hypothetical protein